MPTARRAEPGRLHDSSLAYPFPGPPAPGTVIEVAPGLLWARLALPFRLDHVNIYLIDDGDGWAVFDTGISDLPTRAAWEALLSGPLAGRRLTRLIVSHAHPDHIGLAGWLCGRFSIPLVTSETCYLSCLNISLGPNRLQSGHYQAFYRSHGMTGDAAALVATRGNDYLSMVTPLPPSFRRILAGDGLGIGRRRFEVLTGDGHAAEQVMLWEPSERILLAADQVLARITPNISVWAVDPDGDPLGHYLRSLAMLEARIDPAALVLPGHQLPFVGLHRRCRELAEHHEERCAAIAAACAVAPHSVADLVPVVFPRALDPHQTSFAISEVHAHVNYMVERGRLRWRPAGDGVRRAVAA